MHSKVYTMNNSTASRPRMRVFWATTALLAIAVLFLGLSLGQSFSRSHKPDVVFSLSAGSDPAYAAAGAGLAAVNSTEAVLFSSGGARAAEAAVDYAVPACCASRYLSVFYDVGQPQFLTMTPDGKTQTVSAEGDVTFAHVNENAILTVISEKDGFKGCVMVYDRDLTPLFCWDAGSGYPVSARVSADDILCINTVSSDGSALHLFRIDRENDLAVYSVPEELILDFGFLNDGTIAAVTEDRLIFLNTAGEEIASHDFGGQTLCAFDLDGRFASVATGSGLAGSRAVITTLAPDGEILSSISTAQEVYALSSAGDELLVLYGSEATLYSSRLEEDISRQSKETICQILLNADGSAYLCGLSGVHLVDLDG